MTIGAILDAKGRDVITVKPATPLSDVVQLLREKRIGVVLVSEGDNLKGILSERDIVRALNDHGGKALAEVARDHMTAEVVTCSEADTIIAAMTKMTSGRFRHMPVVTGGKLVGLVSIGDVVKQRLAETEREAEEMRAYIAAG